MDEHRGKEKQLFLIQNSRIRDVVGRVLGKGDELLILSLLTAPHAHKIYLVVDVILLQIEQFRHTDRRVRACLKLINS